MACHFKKDRWELHLLTPGIQLLELNSNRYTLNRKIVWNALENIALHFKKISVTSIINTRNPICEDGLPLYPTATNYIGSYGICWRIASSFTDEVVAN
ncbi:hypothetical protein J6590_005630 [Homalodisca vitripennis]|nr:hypothetical protein J6590_005630 [Homalodisca vitripennis]